MRLRRPRENDEVVLLNSASVSDGERTGIILSFYRPKGDKTEFKGTYARWDTPEGWSKVLEGLGFLEPAKPFTLGDIGAERFSDLPLKRGGAGLLVLKARKMVSNLLKKAVSREEFLERNSRLKSSGFMTEFEGTGLFEIKDSEWHLAERKPCLKRPPRRIIY